MVPPIVEELKAKARALVRACVAGDVVGWLVGWLMNMWWLVVLTATQHLYDRASGTCL